MLILDCKIGSIIKLRKGNEEISIKAIKKIDSNIHLSILSKNKFILDNILYSFKLITLGSGQDFIITGFSFEKIRIVILNISNKISIGFDADKSINIRKNNNRKRN